MPATSKAALFGAAPAAWPVSLLPEIRRLLREDPARLVVLDDDPTGTQTVHDVPVLTAWPVAALREAFAQPGAVFYILTNSRGLTPPAADALNREIAANLLQAAEGRPFHLVSRSDSTLRGHFPLEARALAEALPYPLDAWLLVPFFEEGGRFTLDGTHYVAEGETLLPASETPFARDASFGYRSAALPDWVAEKSGGQISAADVAVISLKLLREGGPDAVYAALMALRGGQVCAVDALSYRDLEVLVLALLRAEAQGRRYLYRTAASFVRTRAGQEAQPLLSAADLGVAEGGGLVVVGSYVPKTSAQLAYLLDHNDLAAVELRVEKLLGEERDRHIAEAAAQVNAALAAGRHSVLYTSRDLITGADAGSSLHIGQRVSEGLMAALAGLAQRPAFVVAKGGITSSDVATKALSVRRALVRGQIAPGIPVWELDAHSRFPGMPYVVFPGNVGETRTLSDVVAVLTRTSPRPNESR